ncbi:hypothetical protein ACOJUR_03785 [Alicyclobacillus tolerans]|uniref:Uncharacterized protein n=2 Tax=Alicyclobacillus tolerans TaxID=90970 RepID=A0A1M6P3M1_9BACL|nr:MULTISPECIES: hypothetical protein [Alicyclobacillus]MDP9729170.1 hypothetical protein [Alicyclobacillus tengchongensis]SHK02531.1 hypothetical protein SAMN05443507_10778 [Alicyclobacillus montanus]
MLKFVFAMIVPLMILIYTISFGLWMRSNHQGFGSAVAYVLGVLSFSASGFIFWRMFT